VNYSLVIPSHYHFCKDSLENILLTYDTFSKWKSEDVTGDVTSKPKKGIVFQ
jgi:hypothetical protein